MRVTGWLLVSTFLCLIQSNRSLAQDTATLTVQPKKCVVLQKGKNCYKEIRISFTAPISGEYCLRINRNKSPLKCWENTSEGKLTYVFNDDSSAQLILYQADDKAIAETNFSVAWVYNNQGRRKNHWRRF